jgi:ferredoxin-NADP reductase
MARRTFDLELVRYYDETPNVRQFIFRRADGETVKWIPGQFVMIHFEIDDAEWQRSYSIATRPDLSDAIELGVAYVENGRASRFLWGLEPGDRVTTSGPYGRFILRKEEPRRYVLVATGTGVAPYRAMLPEIAERMDAHGLEIDLVLGVRHAEDLLYGNEFVEFADAHPGFRFRACFSRSTPDGDPAWCNNGYVQGQFETLDLDPEQDIVYLCGNPAMVDDALDWLKNAGFSPFKVRREKYIS